MEVEGAHATALHCNPNLMTCEERYTTMKKLAAEGIQSVVFNYRNVGDSGGGPATLPGLLHDAEAVRSFIASPAGLAVPNHRIILWGHSIGGAVATHLAGLPSARGVRLVADRSFSSLAGFASDVLLGKPSPLLESTLEWLTGWRFGVAVAWHAVLGKKVIVEHVNDEVIPKTCFPRAHIGERCNVVDLGKPSFDAHCRDLTLTEIQQVLKYLSLFH